MRLRRIDAYLGGVIHNICRDPASPHLQPAVENARIFHRYACRSAQNVYNSNYQGPRTNGPATGCRFPLAHEHCRRRRPESGGRGAFYSPKRQDAVATFVLAKPEAR